MTTKVCATTTTSACPTSASPAAAKRNARAAFRLFVPRRRCAVSVCVVAQASGARYDGVFADAAAAVENGGCVRSEDDRRRHCDHRPLVRLPDRRLRGAARHRRCERLLQGARARYQHDVPQTSLRRTATRSADGAVCGVAFTALQRGRDTINDTAAVGRVRLVPSNAGAHAGAEQAYHVPLQHLHAFHRKFSDVTSRRSPDHGLLGFRFAPLHAAQVDGGYKRNVGAATALGGRTNAGTKDADGHSAPGAFGKHIKSSLQAQPT